MSGHWYSPTGSLLGPVQQQNGKVRDYNLRDARRDGALPSVTTILSLLDKPGLNNWRYERVIAAAINAAPRVDDYPSILSQAFAESDAAADFGTAVHAGISAKLLGQEFFNTDIRILECVKGFWDWYGEQTEVVLGEPEHSFASTEWGFAGTVDSLNGLYLGQPANFDFKTRESGQLLALYDPEEPLQHAGYALGTSTVDNQWVSIHISRTEPGMVYVHPWEDHDRYSAMWAFLLGLWQLKNKYYPGEKMKELLATWM